MHVLVHEKNSLIIRMSIIGNFLFFWRIINSLCISTYYKTKCTKKQYTFKKTRSKLLQFCFSRKKKKICNIVVVSIANKDSFFHIYVFIRVGNAKKKTQNVRWRKICPAPKEKKGCSKNVFLLNFFQDEFGLVCHGGWRTTTLLFILFFCDKLKTARPLLFSVLAFFLVKLKKKSKTKREKKYSNKWLCEGGGVSLSFF